MVKKITLLMFYIAPFVIGCEKDNPPIGDYIGFFNGSYMVNGKHYAICRTIPIKITESDKNKIIFDCSGKISTLEKEEKKIIGLFETVKNVTDPNNQFFGPISIIGEWEKKSGRYIIHGSFESTISRFGDDSILDTLLMTGTFEIESEF